MPPSGSLPSPPLDVPELGAPISNPSVPNTIALDAIEEALAASQYRQAWTLAKPLGDLRRWRGARARVLAGRLASHFGAHRLGDVLFRLAVREHPNSVKALLARGWSRPDYVGLYRAWFELDAMRSMVEASSQEDQADWYQLRATIACALRDFDRAHSDVDAAVACCDEDRTRAFRSKILEGEDRIEEARTLVDEVLQRSPDSRIAIQLRAHYLRLQGEDDSAHAWLVEASERIDYPLIHLQIAQMDMDLERWSAAEARIRRFASEAPALRLDRHAQRSLQAMRAHVFMRLGRRRDAADLLEWLDAAGNREAIERLRDSTAEDRRIILPVPWVRQNHDTCSPATLTALCQYWRHPAEHPEIVEKICYGGTPAHSERRWARENGLFSCELTVDWPTAVALIDRGVPFTLVTSDAANAHLQAVVGYDLRMQSLICRDPSHRHWVEYDATKFLEALASNGPRGMVLLPTVEAHRLEGLVLPDTELYEISNRVESHLAAHRRDEAAAEARTLRERVEGHRLDLASRWALAAYDRDVPRLLDVVDAMLVLFPDDPRLQLARLEYLTNLERRTERRAEIRSRCKARGADPVFEVALAADLLPNADAWPEAERLLVRATRLRTHYAPGYDLLGQLAWLRGDKERGALLFRWAACLAEASEGHQQHLVTACRQIGRVDEALGLLERRVERFGQRSAEPATTLAGALESLDRHDDALAVIEQAVALRPDDGALALHRVGLHVRRGELELANRLLTDAAGRTSRSAWLEQRSALAEIGGDLEAALVAEEEGLQREPTSVARHHHVARLKALLHGRQAGIEHLRAATERFPHHIGLGEAFVGWSRDQGHKTVLAALDRMLDQVPENAWAWRELAITRLQNGDLEEAAEALARARTLEPRSTALSSLEGQHAELAGERESAVQHYRQAIELDPSNVWAMGRLLDVSGDAEGRRQNLRWMGGLLEHDPFGDAIDAFHDLAGRYLPPKEVLGILDTLLRIRDSWQGRHARAAQLARMGRIDEALATTTAAVDRFPFQPDLRLLESQIYRAAGRPDDQRAALEATLALDPGHKDARVALARLHLGNRHYKLTRQECDIARARNPFDPQPLLVLADMHIESRDLERSLEVLESAIELAPTLDRVLDRYAEVARAQGQPGRGEALARRLLATREEDAEAWANLARMATDRREALSAIENALARTPRDPELHATKARILARFQDLTAAYAACRPAILEPHRPVDLIALEAGILASNGNHEEAIQILRSAVSEDPGFVGGWARITEWSADKEEWEAVLEASERWLDLSPRDGVAWGHRAHAQQQTENVLGAIETYRKSIEIEPTYAYGNYQLSLLLESRGEGSEALALFADLADTSRDGEVLAHAVALAARNGGHAHLGRWIHGMAIAPDTSVEAIDPALEALESGAAEHLELFDRASFGPDVCAPMASTRAYRMAKNVGIEPAWDHVLRFDDASEAWGRAAVTVLACEREIDVARAFRRIKKHRTALLRPTISWGQVGFFFAKSGRWQDAVSVLESYPRRKNAEQWMVYNLVLARRIRLEFAKAYNDAQAALRLEPDDNVDRLRVWVALWEALEHGDLRAAEALPETLEAELDDGDVEYQFFQMTKALVMTAGKRGDGEAFKAVRHLLSSQLSGRARGPNDRLLYSRVIRTIAKNIGGFWPRIWAAFRANR